MNGMKERAEAILEAGIRHYIETGEPVTSKELFESYDFGIRPAMIRAELSALGEEGYFSQHHPSGGRIPTVKAYEFFTRRLLEMEKGSRRHDLPSQKSRLGVFTSSLADELMRGEMRTFIEEMARNLELLGVGYGFGRDKFYESGIYELFSNLDVEEKEDILDVARDIELIESRIDEGGRWLESREWPQVFIGGSPVTRSKELSVIANRFSVGKHPFLLLMIGPVRMDYEKSLRFMDALEESLTKN